MQHTRMIEMPEQALTDIKVLLFFAILMLFGVAIYIDHKGFR